METLTSKYNDFVQSSYNDITPEMEDRFNQAVIDILWI
jgi:hypothetical protein